MVEAAGGLESTGRRDAPAAGTAAAAARSASRSWLVPRSTEPGARIIRIGAPEVLAAPPEPAPARGGARRWPWLAAGGVAALSLAVCAAAGAVAATPPDAATGEPEPDVRLPIAGEGWQAAPSAAAMPGARASVAGAAAPAPPAAPPLARDRSAARPAPPAAPRVSAHDHYLEQAARAFRAGRHQVALERVDRAIERRRSAAAFRLRAEILLASGQAAAALEAADRAVDIAPRDADGWLTKGMVHYQLRQLDDARRALERTLALAPDSPEADSVRLLLGDP
jgi:hypothetical protein